MSTDSMPVFEDAHRRPALVVASTVEDPDR